MTTAMKKSTTDLLKQLLETESHEVDKLKDIVSRSLKKKNFFRTSCSTNSTRR